VIVLFAIMALLLAWQVSIVCKPERYLSERQWKDWNRAINKGDPHPILANLDGPRRHRHATDLSTLARI
jgi:hypothetical protein